MTFSLSFTQATLLAHLNPPALRAGDRLRLPSSKELTALSRLAGIRLNNPASVFHVSQLNNSRQRNVLHTARQCYTNEEICVYIWNKPHHRTHKPNHVIWSYRAQWIQPAEESAKNVGKKRTPTDDSMSDFPSPRRNHHKQGLYRPEIQLIDTQRKVDKKCQCVCAEESQRGRDKDREGC